MTTPFVIFALPRSRTAWLSRFLSYRDWHCGHEQIRYFRSLDDIKCWLHQDKTGTAETAAAPWWRLLKKYQPDARVVVIRRPVEEVVESFLKLDGQCDCRFERAPLTAQMQRLDRKLDQIEARWPNALSVRFQDLRNLSTCANIFEYCLPYRHDDDWWSYLHEENIQCSVPALFRYVSAHSKQLEKLAGQAKHTIISEMASRPVVGSEGLTFRTESFDDFMQDGAHLFREHCVAVDEEPNNWLNKNIELMRTLDRLGAMQIVTVRCNGRMFGYLMTVISPSLEEVGRTTSIHTTFYASPEFPGLGMKLQRVALAKLKERGIDEAFFRAGTRGNGQKMGSLYRRLGAEFDGEMYRLNLRD